MKTVRRRMKLIRIGSKAITTIISQDGILVVICMIMIMTISLSFLRVPVYDNISDPKVLCNLWVSA